jgi:hypothetical protein
MEGKRVTPKLPRDRTGHHKAQHWVSGHIRLQSHGPNWSRFGDTPPQRAFAYTTITRSYLPGKRASRLAPGSDAAAHQRASRLLAAENADGLICERAMQNYVSIHENQTRPNPALAAVQGQAALLLRYDVPTYYVSQELLAACPADPSFQMTWFSWPFRSPSTLWFLCCRSEPCAILAEGDCPFLVLSLTSKGQHLSLPNPAGWISGYSRIGRLPLSAFAIASSLAKMSSSRPSASAFENARRDAE